MGVAAKQNYREWLRNSDNWQSVRLACLVAKDATCEICGAVSIHNHAHHVFYPDRWNDTKPQHLRCVCDRCHKRVHELTKPGDYKKLCDGHNAFREATDVVRAELRLPSRRKKRRPYGERLARAFDRDPDGILAEFRATALICVTRCECVACNMNQASDTIRWLDKHERAAVFAICDDCRSIVRHCLHVIREDFDFARRAIKYAKRAGAYPNPAYLA